MFGSFTHGNIPGYPEYSPNYEVLGVLEGTADYIKTKYNKDITNYADFSSILLDKNIFDDYKKQILDLNNVDSVRDRTILSTLMDNTRNMIIQMEAMGNFAANLKMYESFYFPLIPVFWSKLVAKEAVTVSPIKNREVVKGFIDVSFETFDGKTYKGPQYKYDDPRLSEGLGIGYDTEVSLGVPGTHDLFTAAGLSITSNEAAIEKDSFKIYEVVINNDPNNTVKVNITTMEDAVDGRGNFGQVITFEDPVNPGTMIEAMVSGSIEWGTGIIRISSTSSLVTGVKVKATASLENNTINTKVKINLVRKRIEVKENKLEANFSSELLFDVQSAFNINFQSQLISIMAEQINNDIDRRIIRDLITANEVFNDPARYTTSFSVDQQANFVLGPKAWLDTFIMKVNQLSAVIYTDTRIAPATVLLAHPEDAALLENLDKYGYDGSMVTGGNYGPVGTKVSGKYKLLVSPSIPKGKMLVLMKEPDEVKSTYLFAPYVPGILSSYPLGRIPSITMLTLNGSLIVRAKGIGILNIVRP